MSEWRCQRLDGVAEIRASNVDKKSVAGEVAVRLCNYMDVYSHQYITANIAFMEATATLAEVERFRIRRGDVLLTKDSETPDDIGIAAVVVDDISDLICGYHLAQLKPNPRAVDPVFLAKQLASSDTVRYFGSRANGSTRYGLSHASLARAPVRTTALAHQRYIAEALLTLDDAIEQTEALIAKTQQVKAGLMHDLFTRGVTPDGELRPPRSEAPELYKQSRLGWIPTEWDLTRLGKLSSRLAGRLIVQPHQYFAEVGVPIVFGTNLREGKIITDDLKRISFEADARFAQYRVRAGDLLTVRVGVPGMTAVVPLELDGCHFASIMLIRKTDKADSQWLSYCMNSELIRRQIEMANYGSVQTQFNISDARLFSLAVPELPEQEQLVERMRSIDAQIEAEESHLGKLETVKSGLMHDLLTGRVRVPIAKDKKAAANG